MIVRSWLFAIFTFLALVSASFAQTTEELTITTYYPAPYVVYSELRANRVAVGPNTVMPASDGGLSWADNPANGRGTLSTDQGASIELKGSGTATPYIDFSNDLISDYDARVSLNDDNTVRIYTRKRVEVRDTDTGNHRDIKVKCIKYHFSSGTSGIFCRENLIVL